MLLHPAQVAVVREVFSPTREELARAQAIMRAFAAARAAGEAVVRLGGQFIDPPVVRWAEQVLALAPASGYPADAPGE
jgi:citrate lyase subunit beta/citryl-CoA lyase